MFCVNDDFMIHVGSQYGAWLHRLGVISAREDLGFQLSMIQAWRTVFFLHLYTLDRLG